MLQSLRGIVLIAAVLTFTLTLLLAPIDAFAVGLGQTCGGSANLLCDAGLFCQKAAGRCSANDLSGKCAKVPQICITIFRPVCGCDGKTYGNDCVRQVAKVSLNHNGACN